MLTKGKDETKLRDKKLRDLLFQFITVVVIAALAMLLLNVLSQDKDGRRQVVDNDGAEEYISSESGNVQTKEEKRLAEILSQIKGVGAVDVMITLQDANTAAPVFSSTENAENNRVKGVIIAAEGAGSAVTKNDIISAVSSVFRIPAANVMVFEKESGGIEK